MGDEGDEGKGGDTGDGSDGGGDADERDENGSVSGGETPKSAARSTKRARTKSAALWGLVGGFAFLVLAQGFRLVAGDLPIGVGGLVGVAVGVAVAAGGIAYATEHRLRAERVKRRT